MTYLRRLFLLAALALLGTLAAPPRQAEAGELDNKIISLASKLADYVKEKGHNDVALSEITGPPSLASNGGPGIQTRLAHGLSVKKIAINKDAALIIDGKYLSLDLENRKEELIVRVILKISDKNGEELVKYSDELTFKSGGNDEIPKLLNKPFDLSEHTKATPEDANKAMKKQLKEPPIKIDEKKIKTTEKSPYAVEVLVQSQGKGEFHLCTPVQKDGHVFIELHKNDVYKLRLHNNTKHEAAVNVTIDGVDAFAFYEPADKKPSAYLVGIGGTRDVQGWTRDTEKFNEFLVGSFADSAAAKVLKSSEKLGTITVCFHPCWTGKTPDEYGDSRSADKNGTGLGKEGKAKTVVTKRTIGPLVTVIAICYNK